MRKFFIFLLIFTALSLFFKPTSVYADCIQPDVQTKISEYVQIPSNDPVYTSGQPQFEATIRAELQGIGCDPVTDKDAIDRFVNDFLVLYAQKQSEPTPVAPPANPSPTLTEEDLTKLAGSEMTCGFAGITGKNICCGRPVDPNQIPADSVQVETSSKCLVDFSIAGSPIRAFCLEDFVRPFKNWVFSTTANMQQRVQTIAGTTEPYCLTGIPSSTSPFSCTCTPEVGTDMCYAYFQDGTRAQANCVSCMKQNEVAPVPGTHQTLSYAYTALGCIDVTYKGFIEKTFFGLGIGFAGLVALLCIIYCAFTLQTSAANPEKIKHTQEVLTSCITGLMLIIFSIFILRIIGVDLLRIPGFG